MDERRLLSLSRFVGALNRNFLASLLTLFTDQRVHRGPSPHASRLSRPTLVLLCTIVSMGLSMGHSRPDTFTLSPPAFSVFFFFLIICRLSVYPCKIYISHFEFNSFHVPTLSIFNGSSTPQMIVQHVFLTLASWLVKKYSSPALCCFVLALSKSHLVFQLFCFCATQSAQLAPFELKKHWWI